MQSATPAVAQGGAPAPAAADIEVLLIKLGARVFGIPLGDVRYVAPMPADFRYGGAEGETHFVFEGSPLAYVSLWDRLGVNSAYGEYVELQAMLPQRRQDHLDWMAALESSIRTGAQFSKARNPHDCAFGKWYYSHHFDDRRLSLLLGQFEQPHSMIHGLADRLLGMAEAGQGADAMHAFDDAKKTTLAQLLKLFDSAGELVAELQRRIGVIVADGDDTCSLGADGVSDIVTIPAERVKPNTGHSATAAAHAMSALLVLDERTVVPLLNWRGFLNGAALPQPA